MKQKFQSKGIGSELLSYIKTIKTSLTLNVYVENKGAVHFYKNNGFKVKSKVIDEKTNHIEYIMEYV